MNTIHILEPDSLHHLEKNTHVMAFFASRGLYADVMTVNESLGEVQKESTEDGGKLADLLVEYNEYKKKFVENIEFDPSKMFFNGSKWTRRQYIPPKQKEYAPLQLIHIYFDTNTYDKIQRSLKISTEGQLGLIGGTMGLFTGFSILSGIEMIYFALKFCLSLKTSRKGRNK